MEERKAHRKVRTRVFHVLSQGDVHMAAVPPFINIALFFGHIGIPEGCFTKFVYIVLMPLF